MFVLVCNLSTRVLIAINDELVVVREAFAQNLFMDWRKMSLESLMCFLIHCVDEFFLNEILLQQMKNWLDVFSWMCCKFYGLIKDVSETCDVWFYFVVLLYFFSTSFFLIINKELVGCLFRIFFNDFFYTFMNVIKTSCEHALFDSSWIFYVETISLWPLLYVYECHKNVLRTCFAWQ